MALVLAGCAKISAPVGGEPDRAPPQVVATDPELFAVLPGRSAPVVIKFDERISEKRVAESVMVSPETGAVRVKKGRSELRISIDGGWRPGQIYRVVVLPVLQDLFGNTLKEEIELIFSTGPEIPATAVAGQLTDRLTGQVVAGARVEAISGEDSTTHVAVSDTAGFFALRHIPPGRYTLRSYLDRNRNNKLDFGEPVDTATIEPGATDTVIVSHALLPPDTTPARLVRAEAKDSLQVRLTLDDHLDPKEPLAGVMVELRTLPDSVPVAVARVMHLHEFEKIQAEEKARADSIRAANAAEAAAALARDSAAMAADSAQLPRPKGVARPDDRAATAARETKPKSTEPLPTREFVLIPEAPLAPGTTFWVMVSGIRNINGLDGGGGSVTFATAAVEKADPQGADTDGLPDPVPPDSVVTPQPTPLDTVPTPRLPTPPDSVAVPPRRSGPWVR